MNKTATRELTEDEMHIFMTLEINPEVDELFNKIKSTDGGWVLKAIEKRFGVYNMNVDKRVMIGILTIGDGVVGKCAKYVDDIAKWSNKSSQSEINWKKFKEEIYPWGIPII